MVEKLFKENKGDWKRFLLEKTLSLLEKWFSDTKKQFEL